MSWERNRGSGGRSRNRALAELAGEQQGVVSLDQLRRIHITQRAAEYRAGQSGLHRVHRGVYAVGHEALGRGGELRAALLACGTDAVISHGTAAALWGLLDRWPVLIDVTVGGQAGRKVDGVRCRRCRYPSPEEVIVDARIARTTPARTAVDMAGMLGERSLSRLVERAAVLKLLELDAFDAAIARAKRRRGIATLKRVLEAWRTDDGSTPDVRSDFEALVLPRLVAMGIPRPTCNETLHLGGEKLEVDFLWAAQRLVVETDGRGTHATPVAFQRDRWRDQVLVAAGYRVARATWDQIHDELEAVVARIARALAGANEG